MAIMEECFRYIWVVNIWGIIIGFILAWITLIIGAIYWYYIKRYKNE